MNTDFDNKVAIVTGGTGGIGLGCAELLAARGAKVALVGRNPERLAEATKTVQQKGIVQGYQLDVTDIPAIGLTVNEIRRDFGEVDILVANAGLTRRNLAENVTEADWDAVLSTNTKGLFFCNQAVAVQSMIPRKTGAIVNMASMYGLVAGGPNRLVYCVSKAGVVQLTRQEAIEWAPYNIRVNAVAPTFVLTSMTQTAFEDAEFKSYVLDNLPLRRLATVQDVAEAVCFLASDAAGFITGVTLPVDGGWTAH